ncbi:hypothetical protein ACFW0V_19805 [Micromonospora parva]|uniref:hypothetical protein n=1 Tax=Micromonospora parva TaxID=1464048 RepID=UPI00366E643E
MQQSPSNEAYRWVICDVIRELDLARAELDALTKLAAQPGLPFFPDTNVFHTWQRPDRIDWLAVLRGWTETARTARLVVPLRAVDELAGVQHDHLRYRSYRVQP